jgi:membrane protein DedA with SNARE-associated domain
VKRYRVLLPWNAIGGLAWSGAAVVARYLAGESYRRVEKWLGTGAAVVVGAIVLALVVVWWARRRRREQAQG